MRKPQRLFRRLLAVSWAGILLGCSVPASALTYTDTENKFRLEIPESDSTYYYTPQSTNLFEDLLEQVENSGRDIRLLVRTYTPADMLGYSLEVSAGDLPAAASGAGGQEGESSYQDIQLFPADEQAELTASVRQIYEGRFNLSEPYPAQLQGLPALRMNGTGVSDTGWGQYDCEVYLLATNQRLLTVTLITEAPGLYNTAELTQEGKALLQSITIGETALSVPTETPQPSAAKTPAVTPSPTYVPETPQAAPQAPSAPSFTTWLKDMWAHNRLFLLGLIAGLCAVAALIAVLCMRRSKPKRKRNAQTGAAYTIDDSGAAPRITRREEIPEHTRPGPALQLEPAPPSGDTRINKRPETDKAAAGSWGSAVRGDDAQTDSPQAAEKVYDTSDTETGYDDVGSTQLREEEDMVASGGYNGQDYDFAEDISRYTQQPGPEVNDVSRYTQGYGAEDHNLRQLSESQYITGPSSRPSVGSRVERNKTKRRRSK